MSHTGYRLMMASFWLVDRFSNEVGRRVGTFGILEGMTIVDYGCGPGRYTIPFARSVGRGGKVYAVDVEPLALSAVGKKAAKAGLRNIVPVLAHGNASGLPDRLAHLVCALDMIHGVREPVGLLRELRRISRDGGILVVDDGHQSRERTKQSIVSSEAWDVVEESKDHLTCRALS